MNWPATLAAIKASLDGLTAQLGQAADVSVRLLSADEIEALSGTDWAVYYNGIELNASNEADYYVVQITFGGSPHDQPIGVSVVANQLNPTGARTPAIQTVVAGDEGESPFSVGPTSLTGYYNSSIAMQSNGTYVIAYTHFDNDGSTSIVTRTFDESTDTAGPSIVEVQTDVSPTGVGTEGLIDNQVLDGGTLATANGVGYLVLDASEPLFAVPDVETQLEQTSVTISGHVYGLTANSSLVGTVSTISGLTLRMATNAQIDAAQAKWEMSVFNPDVYSLSLNGTPIGGAIAAVHYGLNEAYVLGQELGVDIVPTSSNRYQIVLTLDSDSTTAGNQTLATGAYQLTVNNYIEPSTGNSGQPGLADVEGNSLGLTGFDQTGSAFTFSFHVTGATPGPGPGPGPVSDKPINTTTTGAKPARGGHRRRRQLRGRLGFLC